MKIYDALTSYLYNKDYYLAIYDDKIYIYKYKELSFLSTNKLVIDFDRFTLEITGKDLIIIKMNDEELMIQGLINDIKKCN